MKACWMVCLVTALSATSAWAESPLQRLQFEQQKQQVVKDVKQNCPASSGLSDSQFANRVLESKENKTAVQSATRALDKNDRSAYEKAIKSIQCPTK